MISKTPESKWLLHLSKLPKWKPAPLPTIVLTPHPDDETLGAGGLIFDLQRNGVPIKIIAVTHGENSYENVKNLGDIRKQEQEKALLTLGINPENISRLNITDSSVQSFETELESYLHSIITGPVNIIAPWKNDYHPDHESVGRVAERIASQTKSSLIFYFFWTWHHALIETVSSLPLYVYPLSLQARRLKREAINCYQSQLFTFQDQDPILPENLLTPSKRNFEVYLPL
jgi:LmbE family N-acetylglucosaminyl deacetylase